MNKKQILVILFIFAAVIAVIIYGVNRHQTDCIQCFSLKVFLPEMIRHYIQGFGPWAIVVYVLLYTVNTFSPFFPPIFIMSLAAGAIFGPVLGTVALTLGTLSGTSAAFFTARYVGRSWVEKIISGKEDGKMNQWYTKLSANGFFILLPARLIGFPPYGIIDFICGLSTMKFRDFFLATFIGAIPWVVTQVLLADRFANFDPKDPVLWTLLIVFVLMIVITGKIVKKKQETGNA